MLIKDLNAAIDNNDYQAAYRLASAILASQKPYPDSLRQYAEGILKDLSVSKEYTLYLEEASTQERRWLELVKENEWLFDLSHYNNSSGANFIAKDDAILHYLRLGWRKGFDPSRFFDTSFYCNYKDIAESGAIPLIHYIEFGIKENRATADSFDCMLRAADLIDIESPSEKMVPTGKLGVFLHLFYPELAEHIAAYLNNIPFAFDLYISTKLDAQHYVKDVFKAKCCNCSRIVVEYFPNTGRDVAPFFSGFAEFIHEYPIILKLHSKKSPHEKQLANWLQHILDNLVGSPGIVEKIIDEMISDKASLVYPIETLEIMYGIAKDGCWGHNQRNYDLAEPILRKWGINSAKDDKFIFPAGTMFWCKTDVLRPLTDLRLSFSDFDKESGQIDGTLAHAIERLIGLSVDKLFDKKIKTSFLSWNQGDEAQKRLYKQISRYPLSISGFEKVYHYPNKSLNSTLVRAPLSDKALDIHWVIPNFQIGAGGHMTIFRAISYLESRGHTCTVWIHSLRDSSQDSIPSIYHREMICKHFIDIKARVYLLAGNPGCLDQISGDIVIATDRMSAYPVLSMANFLSRAYFVQDYEPSFFPAGSESIFTERTYDSANGFLCICASAWLSKLMTERYSNKSVFFPLAVDHDTYRPCDPDKKIFGQIAFYVRRSTPRRLFSLGLLALHELFVSGVKFSIVVFGEEHTPDLNIPVDTKYLGILSSSELRDVYAQSYVGLVLSGTNYSLIPNEMLAVGLPVIDIDGEHTRMSYKKGTVVLAQPDPKSLAAKIKELLSDKPMWEKQFMAGIDGTRDLSWDKSFEAMNIALSEQCLRSFQSYPSIRSSTSASPLVSVVIPAYNGGLMLKECVESVIHQNTTFSFDVLLIDSSSTDGSIELVRDYPSVFVHKISQKEFGHGKTRNLGAQLARGSFVAFLTQDAIPANRFWLENLVRPLVSDDRVAGVFGAHIAHLHHSPLTDSDLFNHFYQWLLSNHSVPISLTHPDPSSELPDHEIFYSDNNSCLRKSIWESIPYPDVVYGEDQLWAELILKAGHKKAYAPMAVVCHSHEYGFRETLLRANTEWHYFNEYHGKKLPHAKPDLYDMVQRSLQSDRQTSTSLGLSVDRKAHHFARAAGYYLAGKGYGHLRS
jgi:glycosyltransferase involved in cell wall biosynthesis